MSETIVITGTGVVSPLGVGTSVFINAIRQGQSAINERHCSSGISVGAQFSTPFVSDLDKKQTFLMDPVSHYAVVAAKEALAMAGLENFPPSKIGVMMGVGVGGIETLDAAYTKLLTEKGKVNPFAIPKIMPSAPASNISIQLGIEGPSFSVTSACASSAHAIINGALWLQAGLVDAMIVGGAEAPFAPGLLHAWHSMRIMADDTCRPFSINRRGMVLGEGAGALVLERLSDAKKRGATILAVLKGFSANADSSHIVKPDEWSIMNAISLALAHASVSLTEVGHINAHGTGTALNDVIESAAIATVFGESGPYVSGTKGATGHALGAASALEAIICIHALQGQWIPPTLNSLGVDAGCSNINVVAETIENKYYSVAISHSFAFGGLNAVLVFSSLE